MLSLPVNSPAAIPAGNTSRTWYSRPYSTMSTLVVAPAMLDSTLVTVIGSVAKFLNLKLARNGSAAASRDPISPLSG